MAQTETPGRPGRPRRYDEAAELELLLDAAFEVIRTKGYESTTVADILAEARVSTRSFYRHFASKDDLLRALVRRDAELFAENVGRRVVAAPDPATALTVWIDEILGFGLDRPRAKRAAVLGSSAAKSALHPSELAHALRLLIVPLTTLLQAGQADGSFPLADPETDAHLISAMAWEASNRMREATGRRAKDDVRAGLLAFVGRALGAREG